MPEVKTKFGARKPVMPMAAPGRNFSPRGIAALLAPITRPAFRRRAPAAAQLLADWPQLAGPELASRAAPLKFAGGTLTLGCTGAAAMELQFAEAQIIARLNLGLGHAMVERLRFVQQSPRLVTEAPLPHIRRDIPRPPGLPEGELGEALAVLYQGLKTRG